jgi:8-oxo-dGTP diphosphatase
VPIHLVRHGHAGKRSLWEGDDRERPLSARGDAQAKWLADFLSEVPVARIVSSPYLRCVQTVEPLAVRLGLEVEATSVLAEGGDVDAALDLVTSLDPDHGVACSHGDLIPHVLRRLKAAGMEVDGPLLDPKGSVWVLDTTKGRVHRGRYVPPGA